MDLIPEYDLGLSAFFKYFGSKKSIIRHYPLPKFDTIVEPFAGSASYSMEYPDREIILIEKDRKIAQVWEYLIGVSEDEFMNLPDPEPGQRFEDLKCDPRAVEIIRKRVLWGKKGNKEDVVPSGYFDREKESWNGKIRERLASQLRRIRHWKILEGDYRESPDIEATWFVDPPYQDPTVDNSLYRSNKIDHGGGLAEFCLGRKGQVIACDRVGSTWLPFRPLVDAMNSQGRISQEAVWTNISPSTVLDLYS